jgi:peptidoglycan hydrolase-like amidase
MPTIDASIEIQVAIAEGVSSISFSSTQAVNLRDRNGRDLHTLSEGETYTIRAEGNAIALGSWQLPTPVWIEIPPTGIFRLGDRSYRGQLLLVADSGRLWAVNYVNLRHYLYSVVGSEVSPSWDMEALKAQAVAARSYALTYYFRPANSLYHLGATERYQVYRGIEREANRTSQAVDETAGEFVSHRGGIVESLYAASDDIVAEAFQGRGMSQLGALNLAEQGYSYQQILSNYYPGTGVGRIEQDYE